MDTTIKLSKETKNRLLKSTFSGKDKTFDMIINELLTYHDKNEKQYKQEHEAWKKRDDQYQTDYDKYKAGQKKHEETWNKLLIWARKKGFKD